MRENAEYMKSLTARINRMKTAGQELALTLGDAVLTDGIIATVDAITGLANGFGSLVKITGALGPVLSVVGITAMLLSTRFRTAAISTTIFDSAIKAVGVSARGTTIALRGLLASTGVGLALVAVGFAIEKLISGYSEYSQKKQEQEQNDKKSIESLNLQGEKVSELTKKYKELSDITNPTIVQQNELLKVQNDLAQLVPSYVAGIDATGQAHLRSAEAIKLELERLKDLEERRNNSFIKDFRSNSNKDIQSIYRNNKEIKENEDYWNKMGLVGITMPLNTQNMQSDLQFENAEKYIQLADSLEEYTKKVLQQKDALSSLTKEDQKNIKEKIKSGVETIKQAKNSDEASKKYSDLTKSVEDYALSLANTRKNAGKFNSIFSVDELNKMSEAQRTFLRNLQYQNLNSAEAWNKQRESAHRAGFSLKEVNQIIDKGVQSLQTQGFSAEETTENFNEYTQAGENATKAQTSFAISVENLRKELAPLNSLLYDVRDGQTLSAEAVADLIIQYPELTSAIKETAEGYKIEQSAVEALRQAKIDKAISDAKSERESATATIKNSLARQEVYGIELRNIRTLEEAKAKIAEIELARSQANEKIESLDVENPLAQIVGFNDLIGKSTSQHLKTVYGEEKKKADLILKELDDYISTIENTKAQTELLKKLANDPNFGVPESKTKDKKQEKEKSDTQATLHEITDFSKEEIRNINKVIETRDLNIKSLERQIATAKKAEDYAKTIELTNKLLEEQKGKTEDITQANKVLSDSANKVREAEEYRQLALKYAKDNGEGIMIGFDAWFNDDATASEDFIKTIQDIDREMQRIEGNGVNLTDTQKNQIKELENQKKLYQDIFAQIQNYKQAWTANSEEVQKIVDNIESIEESLKDAYLQQRNAYFKFSEDWISAETNRMTLAGNTEVEIAQMVLDARMRMANEYWTQERGIAKLTAEEQLAAEMKVAEARKRLYEEQRNQRLETLSQFKKEVESFNDQLDIVKNRLSLLTEGTKEYYEELAKQTPILKEKLAAEQGHEEELRRQMNTVDLTRQEWEELNDKLRQSVLAQIEIASSIKSTNQQLTDQLKTLADEVIDIYKDMYSKQKDIALKNIDKELDILQKSHDKKIEMLDEEMSKYTDLINMKLRALEDESSEEDYNKELAKLQKERDEISNKISVTSLNNSPEARARLVELNKQLADKNEEIEKKTTDRSRELQKKNLQDQLSDKQKQIEKSKKQDKDYLDSEKERIEDRKKYWETYYENLLNDEREFEKIRSEIMSGNFERIKMDFSNFKNFLIMNSDSLGISITNNLTNKMNNLSGRIQSVTTSLQSHFSSLSINLENSILKTVDQLIQKFKELEKLSFSQNVSGSTGSGSTSRFYAPINSAENEFVKAMKHNSELWHKNPNSRASVEQENQRMGAEIGATYQDGTWYKNGLPLYHNGGVVGKKGSKLIDYLHRVLNIGSNEELAVLKQGELVVRDNPMSNIISNLMNSTQKFDFSKLKPASVGNTKTENAYHIQMNIDKLTGDKAGAESVLKHIVKGIKQLGK